MLWVHAQVTAWTPKKLKYKDDLKDDGGLPKATQGGGKVWCRGCVCAHAQLRVETCIPHVVSSMLCRDEVLLVARYGVCVYVLSCG